MKYLTLLFAALAMTGCSALGPKPNETLARGIYATADSIDAGRFDLADRYSHGITKLVPPPKKRITISPIDK